MAVLVWVVQLELALVELVVVQVRLLVLLVCMGHVHLAAQ